MQGAALLAQLSELHGDVDAAIGQYEQAHQLCQQQHSEAHPLAVQVPIASWTTQLISAACRFDKLLVHCIIQLADITMHFAF